MVISTISLVTFATIDASRAIVKLEPLKGRDYTGTPKIWLNAQVEQVILSLGAEPSTAKIVIPVSEPDDSLGTTSNEIVHSGTSNSQERITKFSAPNFAGADNFLFSRVFIFDAQKDVAEQSEGSPYYVGYITDYEWNAMGDGSTSMTVICQDARYFMKKAPVQGRVHFNDKAKELIYIRSSQPIFNEGRRSNRFHDVSSSAKLFDSNGTPRFVDIDLNRFFDKPGDLEDRQFVADDQVETLTDNKQVPNPHARKWLPGHVWNYYRYVMNDFLLPLNIDKPTSTEIGRTPDERDFPVSINQTVDIPLLDEKTDDGAFRDFFRPRAQIGGATQTGTTEFVSGLGEYAPNGVPLIDVLMDMCQRVGNYTLAAIYSDSGILNIVPFRTCPAFVVPGLNTKFGLRNLGALVEPGAGKPFDLKLKNSANDAAGTFPEAHSWNIKQTTVNYYNRYYMQGGQRFIQLTFSTMGTTEYTDLVGNTHAVYTPANQWNPLTVEGSIQPGWTATDQTKWIVKFDDRTDQEQFVDVFRTWVVPDDFDWLTIWNQAATAQGFRMFLEKERQHLGSLISAAFEKDLGIFRSRKIQLPHFVWRAYQGIAINAAGDQEKYGGAVGRVIEGNKRWWRRVPIVKILTDGRLGFQLNDGARSEINFRFEDEDANTGKPTSPWSWNGETAFPRAYEMIWTVAIAVDEDLYDYKAIRDEPSELVYENYGPPMEMHRNAGSEYHQHFITNSIVDVRGVKLEQPIVDVGGTVKARDDEPEIAARVILNMNRHAKPDIEGDIALDSIHTEYIPGQAIHELKFDESGRHVRVNAIISKVIHNYVGKNETILQIATVR